MPETGLTPLEELCAMETHAFGFRVPANAQEGQKRFPISFTVGATPIGFARSTRNPTSLG